MQRLRILLLAGALATAVVAGAQLSGVLHAVGQDSVDVRFALRDPRPPTDVAVVAVDDVTFSDLGLQWPFPRSQYARAADVLTRAGAREIVFDVQFTEKTKDAEDWALYQAIKRAGGAVLATSETNDAGQHNVLGGEQNLRAIGATAAASNLPDEHAGVVRRFDDRAGGLPTVAVTVARRLGRPVDPRAFAAGPAWIDFRGGPRTIPTYSFSDVVSGRTDRAAFRGKVVVIGASAPTLQDVHPTAGARQKLMSGPEIQANAIWTALHGVPLRSAPGWLGVLATALLCFIVPLAGLRLSPLGAALSGLAAGVLYVGAAWLAFSAGLIVDVVGPLLGLFVATAAAAVAGQVIERRARRRIAAYSHTLEDAVRARTADMDALQVEIIERLGQAVESRDQDTGAHIGRIGMLCFRLARASGLDRDRAEMLRRAAVLHDVGKIAIPDAILRKPGPLDREEWQIMKTHTTAGAQMLSGSRSPLVRMAEVVALTHHEKWNGEGYPHGLAGADIPIEGRIVALCDVYDALVSRRPYKDAWAPEDALAEIERGAGTHFDPVLAETFMTLMRHDAELRAPHVAAPPVAAP